MLSLLEIKKSLGDKAKDYTDEELLRIRDDLYQFADIAFDMWLAEKTKNKKQDV